MCARRFAPNAHASLRICLPAHTARTLYVVTPPDAPRAGRQFLRLAMPVQVLRTFPATARCALVSPAALPRRSVPPPQTRSLFPPPAAVAYLPPPGHAGIPDVERRTAGARPSTYGILRHSIPQNDKFKVGSAPGINAPYSVILRPQAEESRPSARRAPLIRGAGSSRLARVYCRSVFPPSRYASTSAARSSCHSSLREIPPCTGPSSFHSSG